MWLVPWVDAARKVGDALYEFSPTLDSGEWDTTHLNAKGVEPYTWASQS